MSSFQDGFSDFMRPAGFNSPSQQNMASFIFKRWSRALFIFLAVLFFVVISFIVSPTIPRHVAKFADYLSTTKAPSSLGTISDLSPSTSLRVPIKPTQIEPSLPTPTPTTSSTSTSQELSGDPSSPWTFDHTKDSNIYGLTPEQCNSAFPSLFKEIDRATEYQKNDGPVTSNDLDISWKKDGAVRAMIFDQQLYILETKPDSQDPRSLAILHSIHRAILTSPIPIQNIEFSFSDSDIADRTHFAHIIWALSRREDEAEKWVMSDFGFWSWPNDLIGSYEQVRREIEEVEQDMGFRGKLKQVVWRGALKTNKHRSRLMEITKGKDWADVQEVVWKGSKVKSGHPISMAEHCRYQFVLQTEGRSYSGRGKYLLNCNSVVIIPKRTWIEPHHSLLVSSGPDQNFVEIEQDFSDLEAKVAELLKDQDKAERIAANGVRVFKERHMTPAAQACYWRKMFLGWKEVLGFEPQLWEGGENGEMRKARGVPFETFIIKSLQPEACTWLRKMFLFC